ncbi:hypothetical protein AURDEDRAFT_177725 [Auricularia subglabra TFB-10046 SS5]|uniref:Uncharacterized protein n=1 Tax=Auricularia subglabra (strain TFB-10046 / SS5) TaxID=717982 RepID=J0L9W8_AURST|nr:hypothetical protein AURDEDRAFT_177725 [Auricularia subglabra TFB-10046 SS5]
MVDLIPSSLTKPAMPANGELFPFRALIKGKVMTHRHDPGSSNSTSGCTSSSTSSVLRSTLPAASSPNEALDTHPTRALTGSPDRACSDGARMRVRPRNQHDMPYPNQSSAASIPRSSRKTSSAMPSPSETVPTVHSLQTLPGTDDVDA